MAAQVAPQVMPDGLLVTVPVPVPALERVSAKVGRLKVAVTVVAAETVTTHDPVPEHPPPLQPVKVEPEAGAAVSGTAGPPPERAEPGAPPGGPARPLVAVPGAAPALENA